MMQLSILFLLVVLNIATAEAIAGVCPNPSDNPRCVVECPSEDGCPDNKICCSNGCGFECTDPVCLYGYDGNCTTEDKLSCRNGTTCVLDDVKSEKSGGKCCIDEEKDLPKDSKVCKEPLSAGLCDEKFLRYFFNETSKLCEAFVWSGCNPNGNNFVSKNYCDTVCGDVCSQPRKKGSCKEKINSWYYEIAECKCKKFSYSGCDGNGNRFVSKSECENACGNTVCPACSMEKKVGPCKAAKPRFYYNVEKGKCQKFKWGGCKANNNNFNKLKSCKAACEKSVCTLPVKAGPCKRAVKRFYFDNENNKCKEFIWGGCKPNGNNFKNMKACKSKCAPKKKNKN